MKKYFIFILLVTTAAMFTACQSTPEQPVVMQKDLEQMIEQGMEDSSGEESSGKSTASPQPEAGLSYAQLCAHYGVPERFQNDFTEQGVTVHADIAIELPETTALPMAHVEAARFSQERVYALFNALCGDTQMYLTPDVRDKAYYEQEILECQAQLALTTDDNVINSLNDHIDLLKEQFADAPDSIDLIPSDGTLQSMDVEYDATDAATGTQMYLNASSDPLGFPTMFGADNMPTAMQFTVYNDIDYDNTDVYSYVDEQGNTQNFAPSSGSSVRFQRDMSLCRYGLYGTGTVLGNVTDLSLSGGPVDDCMLTTTPKQARETVEQLMAKTGMDDMVIDRVTLYSSKREPISDEMIESMEQAGMDTSKITAEKPETQAYVFRLLRQVNEVKVESDHDSSMTNMDGVSYGKEWMYEVLTIAVDDEGVANLYWTGPLNVTEILTEDTAIKPWSDIENVFEKMMPIMYTSYTDYYTDFRIDVSHASLSLQRIMEKDSFTTGLLVPVWNFYGTMAFTNEEGKKVIDMWYCPLLSVNAIDGSVIDTDKGY